MTEAMCYNLYLQWTCFVPGYFKFTILTDHRTTSRHGIVFLKANCN